MSENDESILINLEITTEGKVQNDDRALREDMICSYRILEITSSIGAVGKFKV
jgi:hypothetical protein